MSAHPNVVSLPSRQLLKRRRQRAIALAHIGVAMRRFARRRRDHVPGSPDDGDIPFGIALGFLAMAHQLGIISWAEYIALGNRLERITEAKITRGRKLS